MYQTRNIIMSNCLILASSAGLVLLISLHLLINNELDNFWAFIMMCHLSTDAVCKWKDILPIDAGQQPMIIDMNCICILTLPYNPKKFSENCIKQCARIVRCIWYCLCLSTLFLTVIQDKNNGKINRQTNHQK